MDTARELGTGHGLPGDAERLDTELAAQLLSRVRVDRLDQAPAPAAFAHALRGRPRRPVTQRVFDRTAGTVIDGFCVKLTSGD
ncbi:hypothetical protein [Kitasatospora purpeofusca]|uniref:hypothetical protein n=1 Tax=Kitasatospora purpeofusca TaxID=67352 RepID=UPI003F4AB8A5